MGALLLALPAAVGGLCAAVDYASLLKTASTAAKAAGHIMTRKLGAEVVKTKYNPRDLLTAVDAECQSEVSRIILEAYPSHTFLGEEDVAAGSAASGSALAEVIQDEWLWVVDPIDGTTNFASGMPLATVSIALAFRGEVVVGVVYDPYRDELFCAATDRPTTINDLPVRVSDALELGDAVVAAGSPPDPRSLAPSLRAVVALSPQVRTVRMLGSAALMMAWVAAGRLTAYFEPDLNSWDTAAGSLLVRQAGGCVTSLEGIEYSLDTRSLLCSNARTHKSLLGVIQDAGVRGLDESDAHDAL
ncbi:hypothetical protein AB1Y20_019546 [Prymnesium parvum]|uniref:Inositol-1-monophosphatase n=1 Tax=Prymnesium parvum TaxID=97485 RepID=A0AB34JST5_PRYPA